MSMDAAPSMSGDASEGGMKQKRYYETLMAVQQKRARAYAEMDNSLFEMVHLCASGRPVRSHGNGDVEAASNTSRSDNSKSYLNNNNSNESNNSNVQAHDAEQQYIETVRRVTTSFNALSQEVISMKAEMIASDETESDAQQNRVGVFTGIIALLERLQDEEKTKLQMTATLHALKRHEAAKLWSWQGGDAIEMTIMDADHSCDHNNSDSGKTSVDHVPPEPTQIEFENAVQEVTQTLEACVHSINDIIDDLKCELLEID